MVSSRTLLSLAAIVTTTSVGLACEAPSTTVLACDLVAKKQRVEICATVDGDGQIEDMSYTYGVPGHAPELTFETDGYWGAPFFDGFVDSNEHSSFGVGLVHPDGPVYLVYAYGSFRSGSIQRAVLQSYPSHDLFLDVASDGKFGAATFHAECQPSSILGDFDFFRP